jgi:hypothetical protein
MLGQFFFSKEVPVNFIEDTSVPENGYVSEIKIEQYNKSKHNVYMHPKTLADLSNLNIPLKTFIDSLTFYGRKPKV